MSDDFDLDAEEDSSGDEQMQMQGDASTQSQHPQSIPADPAAVEPAVDAVVPLNEFHAAQAGVTNGDEAEEQRVDADADAAPFPTAGLSPVVARSAPASAAAAAAGDEADEHDDGEDATAAAPASSAGAGASNRNKKKKGKKNRAKSNNDSTAAAAPTSTADAAAAPTASSEPHAHTLMSLAASENESSSPRRPRAAADSVSSTPSSIAATPFAAEAPAAAAAVAHEPSPSNTPMSVHSFSVHSGSLAATPVQPRSANTVPASAVAAAAASHVADDESSAAPLSAAPTAAATQRAAAPAARTRSTSARRSDSTSSATSSVNSASGSVRPHTGLSSSLATAKRPQPDLPPRVVFSVTVPKEFECAKKVTKSMTTAAAASAADEKKDTADAQPALASSGVKATPEQQEATVARLYRSASEKEEWLAAERRRKQEEEVAELKQFRREPRPTNAAATTTSPAATKDSAAAAVSANAPSADSSQVSHAAKLYYRAIVEAELRDRQLREAAQAAAAQFKFRPELNKHSRELAEQSRRNGDHTSPTRQARSLSSAKASASPSKDSAPAAAESKTNDSDPLAPPSTIIAAFTASSNADFAFRPTINPNSKALLAASTSGAGSASSAEAERKRKKAERLARHAVAEAEQLTFRPVINPPHAATASWTRHAPGSAAVSKHDTAAAAESKEADAEASTTMHRSRAFNPSTSRSSTAAARAAPLSPRSQTQVKELYKILYKEDGTASSAASAGSPSKRAQGARPQTAAPASSSATSASASALNAQDRPKSAATPASASDAAGSADSAPASADPSQPLQLRVDAPETIATSDNVTPPPLTGSDQPVAASEAAVAESASAADDTDAAWTAAAASAVPELTLDQTARRTRGRSPTVIAASNRGGSSSRSRDGSQSARTASSTQPAPVFVAAHIPARMQVWSTQAAERKDLIRKSVEERALAECTFVPKTNAPVRRRSAGRGGSGGGSQAAAAATLARAQRIAREWTNAATFAVPPTGSSPGSSNSPSPSGAVDPAAAAGADAAATARPGSASSAVHQRVLPSRSLMVSSTLVPEVHALGFHFVRQERARVLRREEEFVRTGQHRGVAIGATARSTSATRSAAPTVAPTVQVSPRAHQRIVAPLAQQPARSYVELHVPSVAVDGASELPQPQPQPQQLPRSSQPKPQPQQLQSKPRSQAAPTAAAPAATVLAPAVALPFRPTRLHQAAVATVPSHRLSSPPRLSSTSPHGPRSLASSSARRKSQSPRSLLRTVGGAIDAQGNLSFAHSPAGSPRSRGLPRSHRLSGGSGSEALLSPNSTLLQLSSLDLGHAVGASPPFASRSLPLGASANATIDLEHDLAEEDKEVWQAQVLAERLRLEHARLRALQRSQQSNHKESRYSTAAAAQQQQQQWSPNRGANGLPPRKAAPQNPLSPPRSNAAPMPPPQQQQQYTAFAHEPTVTAAPARHSALQSALAAVTDNLPNLDALLHRSMLREMEHRGELAPPSLVSPHHGSAGGNSPLVLVPVAALSSMSQASRSHSPASMLRAMELHSPSSVHSSLNSPQRAQHQAQHSQQQQVSPVQFTTQASLAKDLPPSPVAAYFSPPPQPMQPQQQQHFEQRTPPSADTTTAAGAGAEPSISRARLAEPAEEEEPSFSRRSASASAGTFDAGSVDPDLSFGDEEPEADESITSEVEEELYEESEDD